MKLSKGKCKGLRLERRRSMYQHMVGAGWSENSFAEMDLAFLVNKLDMSQQGIFVAKKANSILSCIGESTTSRLRELILLLYSTLVRHIWSTRSSSEFASEGQEMWTCWGETSEEP